MTSGTLVTCFPTCITCYRYVKDFLLHCWSDITYQYLSQEYNPDILPPLEPRGEPGKDGPAHHKGTCCPRGVDVVLVHPPALQKKIHKWFNMLSPNEGYTCCQFRYSNVSNLWGSSWFMKIWFTVNVVRSIPTLLLYKHIQL